MCTLKWVKNGNPYTPVSPSGACACPGCRGTPMAPPPVRHAPLSGMAVGASSRGPSSKTVPVSKAIIAGPSVAAPPTSGGVGLKALRRVRVVTFGAGLRVVLFYQLPGFRFRQFHVIHLGEDITDFWQLEVGCGKKG